MGRVCVKTVSYELRMRAQRAFSAAPKFLLVAALGLAVTACSTLGMRNPVPQDLVHAAVLPTTDLSHPIRYWGDNVENTIQNAAINQSIAKELSVIIGSGRIDSLSISGGGYNGAFGAGYLMGWTERGNRPTFSNVSGISVGALLAPFAFLGPEYDQRLLTAFEFLTVKDKSGPGVLGVLFGSSLKSSKPLETAIASIIDTETVAAIANEHKKGRRLIIGTTNLDAERPVIWNIGAIAISNIPDKVELIRNIMRASAAIPGVYPPVLIKVEANGQVYDEMHVDGGVTQEVVLAPSGINFARYINMSTKRANRNLYVIFNGNLQPIYESVNANAIDIMVRSLPTIIKYLGQDDIKRLRDSARSTGSNYHLATIPPNFKTQSDLIPDPEYLAGLIELGYEMGKRGEWQDQIPVR